VWCSQPSAEQVLSESLPPKILLIGTAGSSKSGVAAQLATKYAAGAPALPVISVRQQLNPLLVKLFDSVYQTVHRSATHRSVRHYVAMC
jgi:hypothetical protein